MLTIDAQVHAYELDPPDTSVRPTVVTSDRMVAAMGRFGVDGAVLVSPFSIFGYDASFALGVYAAHPGRFGLVKPVDPNDPGVADTIADWAATKGTIGIQVILQDTVPTAPGLNRVLAAAARHSLPVNLMCWGRLEQVGQLAARNPHTQLVIDHLGLQPRFEATPLPWQPFADLPKVLAVAAYNNIAIKISGAFTLSQQSYPYQDIWDPLGRIFDAFGVNRCLWASDLDPEISSGEYEPWLEAFRLTDRLSDSDRAALMGETLTRVYNWSPAKA